MAEEEQKAPEQESEAASSAAAPAAAPKAAAVEEAPAPRQLNLQLEPGKYLWGTGRRKSSIARVRIRPGDGKVIVNKKPLEEYFPVERRRKSVLGPLKVTQLDAQLDVFANVKGGGPTGQAGAIMMGLARAIVKADDSYEVQLREDGYLTRDPRMVERKKYGRHGARRGRQTSKR